MKYRPLSNGFFVVSIVGAIISGVYTFVGDPPLLSPSWGFTFTLMFILFMIAALISSTPSSGRIKDL